MRWAITLSVILWALIIFGAKAVIAAPNLAWDGVVGAEGYYVYCEPTPIAGAPVQYDAGASTTIDLVGNVLNGTEYECWTTAYASGLPESADSNHIRFTPPAVVQTIVVPGQPNNVTIQWQ
jgi:hypothetical protein